MSRFSMPRARESWSTDFATFTLEGLPDWSSVWSQCCRRLFRWSLPPNWSARDWFDEMLALGLATACQALQDFDPARGVPLSAFVRLRVLAAGLTRYRQEWAYAAHCPRESSAAYERVKGRFEEDRASQDQEAIHRMLATLKESERELIEHLYWDGWTESKLAEKLGVSQAAVSKRKRSTLLKLRGRIIMADK